MQRCLGIDWGSKNIGLAISDEAGKFAFPYKIIQFRTWQDFLGQLHKIIEQERIGQIIIGLPMNFKQQDTAQTGEIRQTAEILKKDLGLPVQFQDELFTSKLAEQHSAKNIDASAAALILQAYLDKTHAKKQD